MEGKDVNITILSSFSSISVSPTSLVFDKELANSISPEDFVATVNQCLQLHSCNKVEKFHIYFCPWEQYLPDIRNWIEFAVAKGVEELNLDLSMGFDHWKCEFTNGGESFPLRNSLNGCNTLSSLSLSSCDFCPPGGFSFCQLQSISLKYVSIAGEVLQSLIVNCPLLDSLSLRSCPSLESVTVTSHGLRRLTIVEQWDAYQILINAPQLESFIYYGEHIFDHTWEMTFESGDSFADISLLSDAFISSISMEISEPEHDYIQLLYDLRHVKVLTICSATLSRVGTYEDIKFPILLQNLKELQLLMASMSMEYLAYLYQFFQLCHSPSLEKLFIQLPSVHEDPFEEFVLMKVPLEAEVVFTNIKEVEDPSDIIFHRLKVIKMNKFKGCASEMRLVKFLLDKAIVLESMVLVAPPTPDIKGNMDMEMTNSMPDMMSREAIDLMNLRRQISMFKTSSAGAKVMLHEYLDDDKSWTPMHTEYFCTF